MEHANSPSFGNPLIDKQRQSTEAFLADPRHSLYFHIKSCYPDLQPVDDLLPAGTEINDTVQRTIDSNIEKWNDIRELFPQEMGTLALDAGCGPCSLSWQLRDRCEWIGGDFDLSAMMTGRKFLKDRQCPVLSMDLHNLPFADESFDFVANIDVIEHIDDKTTVFKEFARVLKPGGKLLVHTDNQLRIDLAVKARQLGQLLKGQKPDWKAAWEGVEHGHNHLTDVATLKRHAEEAGLKLEKSRYISNTPLPRVFAKFFYCLFVKQAST